MPADASPAPTVLDVAVADGTIRVEIAGRGTPLILLHGWSLDREVWRPQIAAFSERYRVVAIDRRGFGASTAPPGLAREIEDILVVQQRLCLDRAVIVAMSQGARVALHFALSHPEKVLGLVLQGAPLDGFQPEPKGEDAIPISSYAALARHGQLDRMKSLWRDHALMHVEDGAAREAVERLLERYDGRDLMVAPLPLSPIAADLDAVYAPALIVTGEGDTPWRRLVGDTLAYGLPNGRRAVIEGGGHLCNLTHPAEYNALVDSFVARLARPAPVRAQAQ